MQFVRVIRISTYLSWVALSLVIGACSPATQLNVPMAPSEEFKKSLFVEPKKALEPVPEQTPVKTENSIRYDVYEIVDVTFAPDSKVASLSARATIKSSVGRETVDMVGVIRDDGSASLMDLTPLANGLHRLVGEAYCVDRKACKHIILNVFYNVGGKVHKRQFVTGELLAASDAGAKSESGDPNEAHESEKTAPNAEDPIPQLGPFKGPETNQDLVDQLVPRGETPELVDASKPETIDPKTSTTEPTNASEAAIDNETSGEDPQPAQTEPTKPVPALAPAKPIPVAASSNTNADDNDAPPDEPKLMPPPRPEPAKPAKAPPAVVPTKPVKPPTAPPRATTPPAPRASAPPAKAEPSKATTPPAPTWGDRWRGFRDWVLSPFTSEKPAPAKPAVAATPPAAAVNRQPPTAKPPTAAPAARPPAPKPAPATPAAPARTKPAEAPVAVSRPPVRTGPSRPPAVPKPNPASAAPAPGSAAPAAPTAPAPTTPQAPEALRPLPFPPSAPKTDTDAETAALMIKEAQLAPLLNLREGGVALRAPTEGGLRNASQLPASGEGFKSVLVTANVKFGSGILISFIENAAAFLKRQFFPELGIGVGDIAKERGGAYGSHNTHGNGLAADIGWIGVSNPLFYSAFEGNTGVVKKDFPFEKTWKMIELAYKQRIIYDGREQTALNLVYMSPAVKDAFCSWAKEKKITETEDGRQMLRSILRQNNHYKHFHLAMKCSPHYPATCRHFNDPEPGTGCR